MKYMLNIAFCDDDSKFLNKMIPKVKEIFKRLKISVSIYTFTNGNALIKSLENYTHYYDIIFLDIDMPIINGKEVAKKLRLIDKKFKLIFVTSFDEEILNTFQFDVSDFLPKMLIQERLDTVIKRLVDTIHEENLQTQIFTVKTADHKNIVIKLPVDYIVYLEIVDRKIYLHTDRSVYFLHGYKYTELVNQFTKLNFVDIHRTCIVNIRYIYSIDEVEICLDNGTILPLSRRKRQQVLEKFVGMIREVTEC